MPPVLCGATNPHHWPLQRPLATTERNGDSEPLDLRDDQKGRYNNSLGACRAKARKLALNIGLSLNCYLIPSVTDNHLEYDSKHFASHTSPMAIAAKCHKLQEAEILQRSSHIVSVVGDQAVVFGGELQPREPRDNDVHAISLDSSKLQEPTRTPARTMLIGSLFSYCIHQIPACNP